MVIAAVAVALVVPLGAVGLAQVMGGDDHRGAQGSQSSAPADTRPAVDPASQPSPSPTSPPEAPAALTEQSSQGAQATLRYVLETYAYMMATGDTDPWTNSVDPNCQVCVQFIANAKQLHSQGGWGVGGGFTVAGTGFEGTGEPPASGTATADFRQDQLTIVDDPSKQPQVEPELAGQIQARMVWDGSRWRVGDMTVADVQQGGGSDGGAG